MADPLSVFGWSGVPVSAGRTPEGRILYGNIDSLSALFNCEMEKFTKKPAEQNE